MATVTYDFCQYPLVTSFGAVRWLEDLRKAYIGDDVTTFDKKFAGILETRGVLIGELGDNYHHYLFASRPKVNIAYKNKVKPLNLKKNKRGELERIDFTIAFENASNASKSYNKQPKADVFIPITDNFIKIICDAANTEGKITHAKVTGLNNNAIEFHFSDPKTSPHSIHIVPDLTKLIVFKSKEQYRKVSDFLDYEIHYIGQASTIEKRLDKHEKFKDLIHILCTQRTHHDLVIFGLEFHCLQSLDKKLERDLVEAALITFFKPVLNDDMRYFPKIQEYHPNEMSLAKRIKSNNITSVKINNLKKLDYSPNYTDNSLTLSNGFGFTEPQEIQSRIYSDLCIEVSMTLQDSI
ncbi:hypothetical protein ORN12_04520 [Pantoea vagans]|uniref:hypothetical protein n=1 Tax=Pantoea vagans TaxID=470934 RepID=UPI0022592006|nr:hypothetical protein [Pantoea vagans]MCX3308273.1 hypothetical protein [Pantoea vagans]